MSTEQSTPPRISRRYQITVEGKIDSSWSDWLCGMQPTSWQESDGRQMTTLRGVLADQAALRGLLTRLWDLNLVLCALQQDDPAPTEKVI
ncbi:MAG: hypothetical protein JW726_19915 [Anaerolineales bacterium]|nr:hypothetical protein [Anaerolineales bacterium]